MKRNLLLSGFILFCLSIFTAEGALAQGCRAELVSGPGGIIIDIFKGANCSAVSNRCNDRLRQLRHHDPHFYRAAYCDVRNTHHVTPPPHPVPQPQPRPYVIRAYDRCQAPGVVRCTQEWSDGRVITEDHHCAGCRGYGNPAGDPCGWRCSFPQQ